MASVVGTHRIRGDARAKASGATIYTADVALDDPLIAFVRRSPYPFARIRKVDIDRARAMPGVAAIVYSGNVPE